MKSILEIYSKLNEDMKSDLRYIDEVFVRDVYKEAKPQLVVVDLGAYAGEFGFYCLPFARHIYAVEPDPEPFKRLKEYNQLFETQEKMSIYNFAISGQNGERKMKMLGGGGSHFTEQGETAVDTFTLNTFFENEKIEKVDILKIDVELAENEIFSAPDFAKAASKINLIIGEWHGSGHPQAYLGPHGFSVRDLESKVFIAKR